MIQHNRKIHTFVLCVLALLLIDGCRKDFSATAEHKASYGWEMYELKDYLKSKEWFTNSVMTNEKWKDGYNGLGWSYAKLLELDSLDTENIGSIRTFHRGLIQPKDPWNSTDVHLEILAGLTFAYHAKGNNSEAVKFGSALIDSTLIGLNPSRWHSWETWGSYGRSLEYSIISALESPQCSPNGYLAGCLLYTSPSPRDS